MILLEVTTESGSVYTINVINQRIKRSGLGSVRAKDDWVDYKSLSGGSVGEPLTIYWGTGKDEKSEQAIKIGEGPDEFINRFTTTTPVVKVAFPNTKK